MTTAYYWRRAMQVASTLLLLVSSGQAQQSKLHEPKDLTEQSLEELMNIEVSSVSRKEQRLSQAAAAVYVITHDDIRRSGMTSIPELLRLAPGLDVARIDSNAWAVSSRGFNGRFANKMLVLIDGRSVYTNLYSGVYWDMNDVLIEDIERIEVIRGPGATMWGANAVNGVINIITKSSKATEGVLVSAGAGTDELASTAVRYGARSDDGHFSYRVFGKTKIVNDQYLANGGNAGDRWYQTRLGARFDWDLGERDSLTVHGDGYTGKAGQIFGTNFPLIQFGTLVRDRLSVEGGYGLARWTHRTKNGNEWALQGYFTQEDRNEGPGDGDFRTIDFDFQDRFKAAGRHDLTWGLGYRTMSDSILGRVAYFDPASRTDSLYSSFVQDDIAIIEDKLTVSIGTKFQHNDYSGFEFQPSARILWAPDAKRSFWLAASRAVRTPSRRDTDVHLSYLIPDPSGMTYSGTIAGSPNFKSEAEHAWEAGFRTQATRTVSLDIASFYSQYYGLQGWLQGNPVITFSGGMPNIMIPAVFANKNDAHSYGIETSATWSALPNLKLSGSHTWLRVIAGDQPGVGFPADNAPQQQFKALASYDLTRKLRFDTLMFYVSSLRWLNVPSYTRLDSLLSFKLSRDFEVSVGGRNLLDDRHLEFKGEDHVQNSLVRRAVFLRLLWTL